MKNHPLRPRSAVGLLACVLATVDCTATELAARRLIAVRPAEGENSR